MMETKANILVVDVDLCLRKQVHERPVILVEMAQQYHVHAIFGGYFLEKSTGRFVVGILSHQ